MSGYSIKDLKNITGINAHTIRIWEKRYGFLNPERTATHNRIYSGEDLKKLIFATLLNNNGMKISKIAKMSDAEINEAVLRLSESGDSSINSHIENLKLIVMNMDEVKFEKLFNHLVLHLGFEEVVMKIFLPLSMKLFILSQTKALSAVHVNFFSSLYRQKLYVAIDGLPSPEKLDAKLFVMFLPENEFLDTGLIFCNYMARKRGFRTLCLGASCSREELADIIKKNPECYLFSVATLSKTDLTEYYVNVLSACNDNQKLLIGGSQNVTIRITDSRLTKFKEYTEFQDFLNQI